MAQLLQLHLLHVIPPVYTGMLVAATTRRAQETGEHNKIPVLKLNGEGEGRSQRSQREEEEEDDLQFFGIPGILRIVTENREVQEVCDYYMSSLQIEEAVTPEWPFCVKITEEPN